MSSEGRARSLWAVVLGFVLAFAGPAWGRGTSRIEELCAEEIGPKTSEFLSYFAEHPVAAGEVETLPQGFQETGRELFEKIRERLERCRSRLADRSAETGEDVGQALAPLEVALPALEAILAYFAEEERLRALAGELLEDLEDLEPLPMQEEHLPAVELCGRCRDAVGVVADFEQRVKALRQASGPATDPRLSTAITSMQALGPRLDEVCGLAIAVQKLDFEEIFAPVRYYLWTETVDIARRMPGLLGEWQIAARCASR